MGGDFNCLLNPAIDKKGGIINERKSVMSCIRDCIQNDLDLVDIWKIEIQASTLLRGVENPQEFLLSRLLVSFE